MRTTTHAVATAAASLAAPAAFASGARFNLQQPVTAIATDIYSMHTLMMVICLFIFLIVFGVMFWAVFNHRKSKGAVASHFHENTTVEIVWTIIPVLILAGMAWRATRTIIAMKDTTDSDITIKATGYQWEWGYDYLKGEGEGVHFISVLSTPRDQIEGNAPKNENYLLEVDKPLVVPVGKKIRLLATANDVIHSWWIPSLGGKVDAVPGYTTYTWFKAPKAGALFHGNCAQLCGRQHAFMTALVQVVTPAEYQAWLTRQQQLIQKANSQVTQLRSYLMATGNL